jgi:AraC-like DNA-binding protein
MRDTAHALVVRTLRQTQIAIIEVRSDSVTHERSPAIPLQDAYVACVALSDIPRHEHFEGNAAAPITVLQAGQTVISDLKRSPSLRLTSPIHGIHFQMGQASIDAIARDAGARRGGPLRYTPGTGIDDPVLRDIARLLLPSFDRPTEANRLFVDHMTLAAATHVVDTYGEWAPRSRLRTSGLTTRQQRRATELMAAQVDGDLSVEDLARECGLSAGHFSRAFRRTMGLAPHQWLVRYRVARAKELMLTPMPLSEVALACGFADQSHLTRVFTRLVGISPSAWRRLMQ